MRSFGPGMGSSGGSGGGGGGMIRTVHRAIRAGIGGGPSQEPYSHSRKTTARTTSNRNQPTNTALSLSSPSSDTPSSHLNHPAATWPSFPTEEYDWECIDSDGESVINIYDGFVFGGVPSEDEVHHAVSSLQEVLDPVSFSQLVNRDETNIYKSGSELDWIEPSLEVCNSTRSSNRVYDAFHLLQTEPSVQRMVISLSSDKAVWDAVMNNEVVRELRESICSEDKSISEDEDEDDDGLNPVKQVVRWIFVNTKEKVVELVEKITKIVKELIHPNDRSKREGQGQGQGPGGAEFEEKLRTSFLLSVVVLLIVVVTRSSNSKR